MSATIRSTILPSPLTAKKMQVEIHRIMILPVTLYRCETRSLTFTKESKAEAVRDTSAEENVWA